MHDPGQHRQLLRAKAQGFSGDVVVHAVDLEHDPAGMHPGRPEVDGTLALTHPDLGGLGRHRNVRENPDPDPALTLHVAGDRAAGRLDLARGDALRFGCLQGERAKVQVDTALCLAVDTALVLFAALGPFRLQHCFLLLTGRRGADHGGPDLPGPRQRGDHGPGDHVP